jgi:hypothetical protein
VKARRSLGRIGHELTIRCGACLSVFRFGSDSDGLPGADTVTGAKLAASRAGWVFEPAAKLRSRARGWVCPQCIEHESKQGDDDDSKGVD